MINMLLNISRAGLFAMLIFLGLCQCTNKAVEQPSVKTQINTAHLDALYDQLKVGSDTVGFIHIYSEYPDYHLVGDADEGIACVDDASRAAIFYLRQHAVTGDPEQLRKGKMLIRFLLAMQAPNGYYYNFIWPDGRIHTDGSTTKPEPNFWSWRTLWAFGEAGYLLDKSDPLVKSIKEQREVLVRNILAEQAFRTSGTDTTMGCTFPTWLPKYSGTDQASIILIGLAWMIQQQPRDSPVRSDSIAHFMRHFAEGVRMMQVRQPGRLQDGAFLSWENVWHAYANIQAYGLLTTGQSLRDTAMINSALYEIKTFYPALLAKGGLNHFMLRMEGDTSVMYDAQPYSQIAYGVRPMVWACLKAYVMTGQFTYLEEARALASWFSGNNPAKTLMYDPATGRGYDGISSPDQINKNAGAESTIEALLTLQALEEFSAHQK